MKIFKIIKRDWIIKNYRSLMTYKANKTFKKLKLAN